MQHVPPSDGMPYAAPDPPPLPKMRVQDMQPFTVTGVDFTGALHVRSKMGDEKVYICLFTCATTRAVHLEVVRNLAETDFYRRSDLVVENPQCLF